MERFSLEKWLQDKSRKVVTRTGEPVEIVLTDWGDPFTILGRIGNSGDPIIWLSDGRSDMDAKLHDYDLFFADKEEELTEFESKLADLLVYNHPMDIESAESIAKKKSKQLIDLARKEIDKSNPDIGKQKQEWSEEDERMYKAISIALSLKDAKGYLNSWHTTPEEADNWLESFKDRMKGE